MEINYYDNNGNKINNDQSDKIKPQINNKKSINSRLDDLPVIKLGSDLKIIDENVQTKKEEILSKNKTHLNSQEIPLQTKIIKEKSKYEVDIDTTFLIEFGVLFDNEHIIIVHKDKFEEIDKIGENLYEKHWVKFRLWNFLESMTWKQECMDFIQMHKIFNLNINKFNELKVRRLLLDWSFKDYGDNHRLFHYNNQLTDESMELFFKKFNPNIIQFIVNSMNNYLGE